MNIKHCDMCGKTEKETRIESHKLKREWDLWNEHGWERIDICTQCLNKFYQIANKK